MSSLFTASRSLVIVLQLVLRVFPLVDRELTHWRQYASRCPSPELKTQALASIASKKFHCQGGSVFSLYPGVKTVSFTKFIVALQTISDYLDNLCDRAGVRDEAAFRQLHRAMTDALEPESAIENYYAYYPLKNDGGYLAALVQTCRAEVARLPSYSKVKPLVLTLASLYSDLQVYKHLDLSERDQKMNQWTSASLAAYPGILPQEFAAASGSTLGIFMLAALTSASPLSEDQVQNTFHAYFPWIDGLHILLDYLIDLAEDAENGDLNFITYYQDTDQIKNRLIHFTRQSFSASSQLPQSIFALTVTSGLLAMYLSDPKTALPPSREIKTALLNEGGCYTKILYKLCQLLRQYRRL